MKTRIAYAIAVLLGIVLAYVVTVTCLYAQPPQPGDTPAPVVDGPDVFESGLLTASISCRPTVQAGSVLVLDVSGTSAGDTELIVRPAVPSGAFQRDSDGIHVYVWISRTGHYRAWWAVTSGRDIETAEVAFEVVAGDVPDDPDEPPEDTAFRKYVRELLADVEAANHAEVAATFRGIADRIDPPGYRDADGVWHGKAADLKTSKPIETATVAALFGANAESHAEWAGWWLSVWDHMRVDLRLSNPKDWAEHYRAIAEELER